MHYYGIAIVPPGGTLESLMEPFDEQDERYQVEVIGEEACAEQYRTETATCHVSPDGQKYFVWDSPYRRKNAKQGVKPELPEGWSEVELPLRDYYPNIGTFLEDYKGMERDPERKVHVVACNPNGRYDYYRVGGRFSGRLKAHGGNRVEQPCWEVANEKRRNPDFDPYGKDGYDWCELDDLKGDTQSPYFAVMPGGEWLEKDAWGGNPDGFDKREGENERFWREVIVPYVGTGCTAYAIDAHE